MEGDSGLIWGLLLEPVWLIQKPVQMVVPSVCGLTLTKKPQSREFLESWKHLIGPQTLDLDLISFMAFLPPQEWGLYLF